MATGDMKNNIRKLIYELKQVSYDINTLDYDAIIHGVTSAFLPMIHHIFLDYSPNIASYLTAKNYELYARTDLRFVETVYKILMKEFSYKPSLTKEQFLALGFAERKVILLVDIVKFCREKNKAISNEKKKPVRKGKSSLEKVSSNQSNPKVSSKLSDKLGNEVNANQEKQVINSVPTNEKPILSSRKRGEILKRNKGAGLPTIEPVRNENTKSQTPIPDLEALGWGKELESDNSIPMPCDSLTVTPLKDIEVIQEHAEFVPGKSKANIIEIEDVEPNFMKAIDHKKIRNGSEKLHGNVQDGINITTYGSENFGKDSVKQTSDFVASKQDMSSLASQSDCFCNCNSEKVQKLQNQITSLETSLKDVVTINNELSARIVLLETHNILMEKRIENFISTTNNNHVSCRLATPGKSITDQQRSDEKLSKHKWDEVSAHEQKLVDTYSPDKYADCHDSLPDDFQPIMVATMTKKNNVNDTEEQLDNGKSKIKFGGGQTVKVTAEKNEKVAREKVSHYDGEEILSPLRENEFSFMEEQPWATVLNLQKKLEETLDLFNSNKK